MKRALLIVFFLALLVLAGFAGFRLLNGRALAQQAQQTRFETQPVRRGDLQVTVSATGVVRASQSAVLTWKTSGTVEAVNVRVGDAVSAGQELAGLEQTTLPSQLILAQADRIDAQRALDDLLQSQAQSAQALKAEEAARQALEDALNPQAAQASALKAVARAQKLAETAQRNLDILQSPASPQVIDAARATLLLWQNAIQRTRQEIERINGKLKNANAANMTGETRDLYEAQLLSLGLNLVKYQRLYEDALQRYQRLLQPPDANDLAQARANLELARSQLAQAQLDQERLKDGTRPGDVAVLQAQLDDARRQAERLKNGPDPDRVAAARARLAAAQAAIDLSRLSAPFDGMITAVGVQPGDQAFLGERAFQIDDLTPLLVELQVTEVDVNRLQIGQPATLVFDSAPGAEYHGLVAEVPPVGVLSNDVATFRVKVEIRDADPRLRPAMTAGATIVVADLKDALLLPSSAVRFLEGQRVVYLLRGGQPVPVRVALGLSSSQESQVLEGELQPGDLVVLNPPVQGGGG